MNIPEGEKEKGGNSDQATDEPLDQYYDFLTEPALKKTKKNWNDLRKYLTHISSLKFESMVKNNGQPEIDRNSHKTYGLIFLG